MSTVNNGFVTALLVALIDPHLSFMTDDVIDVPTEEATFRRIIVWISFSCLAEGCWLSSCSCPPQTLIAWNAVFV
jgi:hypothetical protein